MFPIFTCVHDKYYKDNHDNTLSKLPTPKETSEPTTTLTGTEVTSQNFRMTEQKPQTVSPLWDSRNDFPRDRHAHTSSRHSTHISSLELNNQRLAPNPTSGVLCLGCSWRVLLRLACEKPPYWWTTLPVSLTEVLPALTITPVGSNERRKLRPRRSQLEKNAPPTASFLLL